MSNKVEASIWLALFISLAASGKETKRREQSSNNREQSARKGQHQTEQRSGYERTWLLFKLLVETVSGSFCRCHGLFRIGVNGYSRREYWRLIDKAGKLEAKNAIAFVAVI